MTTISNSYKKIITDLQAKVLSLEIQRNIAIVSGSAGGVVAVVAIILYFIEKNK
jgi:nitrate reductase gamma subunit